MDQRIKKLWIKALRSGEFKQCRGQLCKDDKYCALGVLSILALLEGVCTFDEVDGVGLFDHRRFTLSFNVMKWAGIAQEDEKFLDHEEHKVIIFVNDLKTTILELNDSGKTFKEIANYIEDNLE
jgi:hypothetical protein